VADEIGPIRQASVAVLGIRPLVEFELSLCVRADRPLAALTAFLDLFICAKQLLIDAKLPRLGQCAARKDLRSGHQAIDGVTRC
jgi:hypothetical protein